MRDQALLDDSSRLVVFMERYVSLMKDESAILEWEKDVWVKGLRLILLIMFVFLFSITVFVYLDNNKGGIIIGSIFLSSMLLIGLLSCYPDRHQYKITETGIYFRGYRRGRRFRQSAFKFMMIVCIPLVLFSLIWGGPMIFAGAGAGMLGIFALPAMMKERKPKEMAIPWEAIFIFCNYTEKSFTKEDKVIIPQYQIKLRCNGELANRVEDIIREKMRPDCIYTEDYFSDIESDDLKFAKEKLMDELPFVWAAHPKNVNDFI
ncbi:hypothetical protein KDD30_16875 (plasmid) [Photobacterium sp. GJ3]|uniref:hypothetical protein n=1 Tax=Photobacterium sp. GJ3 TaxID=2829502 RepID=UPI001B8CCDD2|nr:hypothetical protein [Photobacterium sp. GJ3]QUJ69847.1 hypothetical protein KDD30_16875 [Photobacterium sp. GJ3]